VVSEEGYFGTQGHANQGFNPDEDARMEQDGGYEGDDECPFLGAVRRTTKSASRPRVPPLALGSPTSRLLRFSLPPSALSSPSQGVRATSRLVGS
jgi:hypothetical protein